MNKAPLITAVEIAGTAKLTLTWNTGETLDIDLSETINRYPAFKSLADPAVFSQVAIEEWGWGHGLDWSGGLDMGADRLYQLCREQAGLFSPVAFDGWIKKKSIVAYHRCRCSGYDSPNDSSLSIRLPPHTQNSPACLYRLGNPQKSCVIETFAMF
jgi:hypothetical protein